MDTSSQEAPKNRYGSWLLEALCLTLIVAALCWSFPPDVNEAHYLAKAKHFWNPQWCQRDLFLQSYDTHLMFYVAVGWLTNFWSLTSSAWIGRLASWLTISVGLVALSRSSFRRPWLAVIGGSLAIILNRYGHLSGEWFVGGVEAKCFAYGLAFLALAAWQSGRYQVVWPLLGAASAFHVLVGGWVTLSLLGALFLGGEFRTNPAASYSSRLNKQLPWIVLGGTFAALGIVPAITQNWGADGATIAAASRYQVNWRLAHHLLFTDFQQQRVWPFTILLALWSVQFLSVRNNRQLNQLNRLALVSVAIAFCGLVIAVLPNSLFGDSAWRERLLTLYWFRTADVLVPLATAWGVVYLALCRSYRNATFRNFWEQIAFPTSVALAMIAHFFANVMDHRPPAVRQSWPRKADEALQAAQTQLGWERVCSWISNNVPADALFLTPGDQQTFKWYAHRAEVVCWKDMPQDAKSVVEWGARLERLHGHFPTEYGLLAHLDSELIELAGDYGAEYMIVPRLSVKARESIEYPVNLPQVYPSDGDSNSQFVVYQFPERSEQNVE